MFQESTLSWGSVCSVEAGVSIARDCAWLQKELKQSKPQSTKTIDFCTFCKFNPKLVLWEHFCQVNIVFDQTFIKTVTSN